MKIIVKAKNIEEVILINKKITTLDIEIDAKHGKYLVDGKSLMGLLSLDFTNGIEFIIHESNDKDKINEFVKFLQKYIK